MVLSKPTGAHVRRCTGCRTSRPLWLSGESYRKGKDPARALAVFDRFLKQEQAAEHLGEVWFSVAEAHRALQHNDDALDAYENALKNRGPYEYEARYQQAKAYMARGKWDRAKDILERNLHFLRQNPVEGEAHARAIVVRQPSEHGTSGR